MKRIVILALFAALLPLVAVADKVAEVAKDDGFVPLFNGKDLSGWVPVNAAPKTFYVKDDMIVTTGKPTGYMRTAKMYENFVFEVEWRHMPPKVTDVGNSGIFVWADPLPAKGTPFSRAIEVQVLVNYKADWATNHGDIFSIWGAKCKPDRPHPKGYERCLPSEDRAKGAGEWNHYRITGNNGVIKLAVNGKEVSGVSESKPRKGYLALEAEGSECHFRNLKIKELPSTKPTAEETCDEAKDFTTLFTGLNLDGWKPGEQKANWSANSGSNVLNYNGKAKDGGVLTSEKEFGDAEVVLDVNLPKDGKASLRLGGEGGKVDLVGGKSGWNRFVIRRSGDVISTTLNGEAKPENKHKPAKGPIVLEAGTTATFANLFARELK